MTEQEFQAIKERVEKATQGQWLPTWYGAVQVVDDKEDVTELCDCWLENEVADANFIAHARQDVPALITELERLRKENKELAKVALDDTYDGFMAQREISRLREALAFYANKQDFIDLADAHITQMANTELGIDKGETARKALAGESNE